MTILVRTIKKKIVFSFQYHLILYGRIRLYLETSQTSMPQRPLEYTDNFPVTACYQLC